MAGDKERGARTHTYDTCCHSYAIQVGGLNACKASQRMTGGSVSSLGIQGCHKPLYNGQSIRSGTEFGLQKYDIWDISAHDSMQMAP